MLENELFLFAHSRYFFTVSYTVPIRSIGLHATISLSVVAQPVEQAANVNLYYHFFSEFFSNRPFFLVYHSKTDAQMTSDALASSATIGCESIKELNFVIHVAIPPISAHLM